MNSLSLSDDSSISTFEISSVLLSGGVATVVMVESDDLVGQFLPIGQWNNANLGKPPQVPV